MMVSVVVPTYNRVSQLSEVIDYLLKSETGGLFGVEIIVVDDGSVDSPEKMLSAKDAKHPFSIQLVRQQNGGPGRARNRGLEEACGELVLFVDDDVLVEPTLIREHVEAHAGFPRSVVFGPYPYSLPEVETSAYRYMKMLVDEVLEPLVEKPDFVRVETVASGNLSIERSMFPDNFYDNMVITPVAEEFALIHRLVSNDVPILCGKHLLAAHTQPTFIPDKCLQEYKYGVGIAEIATRRPETLEIEALNHMFHHNSRLVATDDLRTKVKKTIKSLISVKPMRTVLLKLTAFFEILVPFDRLLFPWYRFVVGSFFFAGVRDGIKKFETK